MSDTLSSQGSNYTKFACCSALSLEFPPHVQYVVCKRSTSLAGENFFPHICDQDSIAILNLPLSDFNAIEVIQHLQQSVHGLVCKERPDPFGVEIGIEETLECPAKVVIIGMFHGFQ